jgi:hypothetical protein
LIPFVSGIIHNFFVAFGVVIGASVFGGIGAILTNHPPLKTMIDISSSIKIWAMAIAIGDTFSSYAVIEKGIFKGEFKSIVKQAIYVITALSGANVAYSFIKLIGKCGKI